MNTKTENENLQWLVFLIISFLCIPLSIWGNGYVISIVWEWIGVNCFHLIPFGIGVGCLLWLVVSYIQTPDTTHKERSLRESYSILLGAMLKPWITLMFIWVVKKIVGV